ncbi:MAG: 16S rRNA (guanine(966)-N(2))-methyltransferase RsmD [Pseudohongiellaceae bacterium]
MPQSERDRINSVRIIGGEYRSRKLDFPSLDGLRPTADRTRETLFNWLQDSIQGEVCLDLFAGSGALGFEALSRGASQVYFIEKNRQAADALSRNIERLESRQGSVYCADAFAWLSRGAQNKPQFGLVFLDPPFKEKLLTNCILELEKAGVMKDGCLVYIELEKLSDKVELPVNWIELKNKQSGSVSYGLSRVTVSEDKK